MTEMDYDDALEAIRMQIPLHAWTQMDYHHLRAIHAAAVKGLPTQADVQAAYMRGIRENASLILAQTLQLKKSSAAIRAMLTHMGMDEDEFNKPTFDQARAALERS